MSHLSQDSEKDIFEEANGDDVIEPAEDIFAELDDGHSSHTATHAAVHTSMPTSKQATVLSNQGPLGVINPTTVTPPNINSNTSASTVAKRNPPTGILTDVRLSSSSITGISSSVVNDDCNSVLKISVIEPTKIGDGLNSFVTYKIVTKTTLACFNKTDMMVSRRFSDFLGLRQKLDAKFLPVGRVVPYAPEKSVVGMAKTKIGKEESGSSGDFVERRRVELERFLQRLANHPVFVLDQDFRTFLEYEGDLPKATNTNAFSGAGVMRLFKSVGDAVNKVSLTRIEENDKDIENWCIIVDTLEKQLVNVYEGVEEMVERRREMSKSIYALSQSCSLLIKCEPNAGLARALTALVGVQEKLGDIAYQQANNDCLTVGDLLKDYIGLMHAVKESLLERQKMFKAWKDAEQNLIRKQEEKHNLEFSGKSVSQMKVNQVDSEYAEAQHRVISTHESFDKIDETLKDELLWLEKERITEFKRVVLQSLHSLLGSQEKIAQVWEAFRVEADHITV